MQAEVVNDQATRTIEIEVSGVPDIDVTRPWHVKRMVIRPAKVVIQTLLNEGEETCSLMVAGPMVLINGETGTSGQVQGYHPDSVALYPEEKISRAPQWVRDLWDQAPNGVRNWEWPS